MGHSKTGRNSSKKAISPIIAIIIILLITISIAGAGYSYLSVYWESTTGQNLALVDAYPTGNEANLVVRNAGTRNITLDEVKIIYTSSGQDVGGTWATPEGQPITQLEPGKLAKFSTTCSGFCEYMISSGGGISVPIPMEIKCTDSDWIDGTCVLECRRGQLIGDVNGDGEVTQEDAELASKVAVGLISIPENLCCIDLTGNGAVSGVDAALIARIAEGLDESPGYCSEECINSDGGRDYYTQGTAQNATANGTDSCAGDILTEYYCSGSSVIQASYDCSSGGEICQAGTCVPDACAGVTECGNYTITNCTSNPCSIGGGCDWNGTGCVEALPTDYISYWRFDEKIDMGTYPYDMTPDETGVNNGSLIDNAVIVSDTDRGNVLSLDGAGDYVSVPTSSSLNITTAFSVSAWFKQNEYKTNVGIIDTAYNANYLFGYFIGNYFRFYIDGWFSVSTTDFSADTDWHHAVGVWNTTDTILYIDGVEEDSNAQTDGPDGSPSYFEIGRCAQLSYGFNGTIDDVMVYDRALNLTEIRQIYCGQGGTAGFC